MQIHPIIDPFAIHYDTFAGDVYTLSTASVTLTAGTLTADTLTDGTASITGGAITGASIDAASNTLTMTEAELEAAVSDDNPLFDGDIGTSVPSLAVFNDHSDRHDAFNGDDALDTDVAAEIVGVISAGVGSSHKFARADHVHAINHSFANNHLVTVASASVGNSEYAVWAAAEEGLCGYTKAEVLADLSGEAGAAFSWNNHNLTSVGTLTAEHLTSTDDLEVQGHAVTFGDNTANDIVLTFDGDANDGTITFDESAGEFDFGSSILTTTGTLGCNDLTITSSTEDGNALYLKNTATSSVFAFRCGADPGTGALAFRAGAGLGAMFWEDGTNFQFRTNSVAELVGGSPHNGGVAANRMTISGTNGDVTLTGDLIIPEHTYHADDLDTYTSFPAADTYNIYCGGVQPFRCSANIVYINQNLEDTDFSVSGDNIVDMIYSDAGSDTLYFGDKTNGDNVVIDGATGQITLTGDARVKKVDWIGAGGIKAPHAKAATFVEHGIKGVWQFANAIEANQESVSGTWKIPNTMDISVVPVFYIGWSADGISPGNCRWNFEYLWITANEDTTAVAQASIEATSTASATSNGLVVVAIPGIALPGGTDKAMFWKITRESGDGLDTIADTVELHGNFMEYTTNVLGEAI